MPFDPKPAERVFVTVGDVEYELVATDKLTWPETKEIKRVSGGMALVEMEKGLQVADPDAWFAWLYVSIRRVNPTLTVELLEATLGDLPITATIESLRNETPEVASADPPAVKPPSGTDAPMNGGDSGKQILPASTPATAGHPT